MIATMTPVSHTTNFPHWDGEGRPVQFYLSIFQALRAEPSATQIAALNILKAQLTEDLCGQDQRIINATVSAFECSAVRYLSK